MPRGTRLIHASHPALDDAHSWWWIPSLCPVCHPGEGCAPPEVAKTDPSATTQDEIRRGRLWLDGIPVAVPPSGRLRNAKGEVVYTGTAGAVVTYNGRAASVSTWTDKGWKLEADGSYSKALRESPVEPPLSMAEIFSGGEDHFS